MPLTIQNKTNRQVLLRLNSGRTHHLGPGQALEDVEPVEVKNRRIKVLQERHLIDIIDADAPPPPRSADMNAPEAVAHIKKTDLADLRHFLSPGEDRVTVLRAMEEKRGG